MWSHSTTSPTRKIITNSEWMSFLGLSRNTVKNRIAEYNKQSEDPYNDRDIISILQFHEFLLKK